MLSMSFKMIMLKQLWTNIQVKLNCQSRVIVVYLINNILIKKWFNRRFSVNILSNKNHYFSYITHESFFCATHIAAFVKVFHLLKPSLKLWQALD